ncbi:DUF4238 domain-containing protein [Paenibacillus polymyxa]|uniref:DUF4238 domain-containing protein n=1 Tax=Paenibacillus polymyxa TaxID=1406 RepID=UPI000F4D6A92|nr:DUF4238 domain-containing protein [Paenibacillus polymyxa]RPE10552.1 DUF4238 domain-containing protein [Paenibacillus polymyxa]
MTKVRHHFVPVFHLSLFTKDGTRESPLWVFDQTTGKQREAVPESVGYEKKLYNVNLPNTQPDVMEDIFKVIEDAAAPIIKKICKNHRIPENDEDYNWLINYIALLSQRTPARMNHSIMPLEEISHLYAQMIVASPEHYESIKQSMKNAGEEVNENVSYEELKEFVSGNKYNISFDNNTRVKLLLDAVDAILHPLGARNWTVAYSSPEVGDFICSDNPVSLHWTIQKDRGIWSSPGHGLLNTEVSVPLSSRITLLGRFEEMPPFYNVSSKENLAILNSYTGLHSDRFVFSKQNDFLWYKQDNTVGNVTDFKKLILQKRNHADRSSDYED